MPAGPGSGVYKLSDTAVPVGAYAVDTSGDPQPANEAGLDIG